jgi:hypothetical protein
MECTFNHISYLPGICTIGINALQLHILFLKVHAEGGSNCTCRNMLLEGMIYD